MESVKIDREHLQRRIARLVAAWTWPLDALLLVTGKTADDAMEHKVLAMHFWLLGIEFPETLIAILKTGRIIFFTSSKKVECLRQVEGDNVVLMARRAAASGAEGEVDAAQLAEFAAQVRGDKAEAVVGMLLKETHMGAFAAGVVQAVPALEGFKVAECREEISAVLATKDSDEIALVKKSTSCVTYLMQSHFVKKLESVIDMDAKQTSRGLCAELEESMDGKELQKRLADKFGVDAGEMELVYSSLQCGSKYELRPDVEPTDDAIPMQGTYLLSLGFKYSEYSSLISRTLLVDPTPLQKKAYTLALEVQQLVIRDLKPGKLFKEVYLAARGLVQSKAPELVAGFAKSLGFVMGLEFKDPQLNLAEKSERKAEAGMVFCISVGFQGANSGGKTPGPWAVWLADTLLLPVEPGSNQGEFLTAGCSSKESDVMYELDEEPPAPAAPAVKVEPAAAVPAAPKAAAKRAPAAPKQSAAQAKKPKAPSNTKQPQAARAEEPRRKELKPPARPDRAARSTRAQAKVDDVPVKERLRGRTAKTTEAMKEMVMIEEHQKELRAKKLEELRERFVGSERRDEEDAPAGSKKLSEYKAYSGPDDVPADVRPYRLQVDLRAEALLVPIGGAVVPFHVRTIKNMSRSTVEKMQFLRVNFFTPGQGKSLEEFPEATAKRVFVKELSFRSQVRENFDAILRGFKEAQKRMRQKELEGDVQKSSSVEGQTLQLLRPFHCLRDLNLRPTLGTGARRTVGTLEAHANGFRFQVKTGGEKLDIFYSQVKHMIFEPCERGSLIVLLHLHLKEPMMAGKRKVQDLQFFTEVAAQTEDLSMRRAGAAHDPDELLEEQREREMKERLNTIFQDFSKKVQELPACKACSLEFDMPYKELEFTGVPFNKGVVSICPTKNALVGLQEWPPFVVDLSEVDVVVFERALIQLREFDMTFIMKNYDQLPVRICTVPTQQIDAMKRWLHEIEIVWYVCAMNMQWPLVMKEVSKDLNAFVEGGGWDVWFAEGGDSESGSGGGDEESDWDDGGDDSSDDAGGGDDSESDADLDDDGSDESASCAESDEGMDWDELEEVAERQDRRGAREREVQGRERSRSRDASKRGLAGGASTRAPPAKRGRR